MRKWFIFITLFYSIHANAQVLSREERKIAEQVLKNMPSSISLLEQMVNVNSGTLNTEGVRKTGELLRRRFEQTGFQTEWVLLPDSLKRAGHLVAWRKRKKGKKIFLIGHLDTVFEPDMPTNPYHLVNDSTASGQGVNDMKGGDVVILASLEALQQLGLLNNTTITAYFTGDEENAGKPESVSRADFIDRARNHEVALGFESAQGMNTVATARRGSSNWELKVYGRQSHSSGVFTTGFGAIYETARILNAFREQLGHEQYLTFNPGIIAGGTDLQYDSASIRASVSGKTNIISPAAIVQGDLRFLRESQKDSARKHMRAVATSNNLAETHAEISFSDGIPGMEPTEGNNKLVSMLNEISLGLGIGPVHAGDPGSRGAGDISYVAKYLDCIDGLGATGNGAHAPGETIELQNLSKLIQRTAILIYRLTR